MKHKTALTIAGLLVALMPGSAMAQYAPGPGYYGYEVAPAPGYNRGYAPRRVIIPGYRYNPWVGPYAGRGFMDPGFAYQGNIPGCAVDLGYGRYEPCR